MSDENVQTEQAEPVRPRLLSRYKQEALPELKSRLNLENDLAVPRLQKIVLNTGIGDAVENDSLVGEAIQVLAAISGQKPVVTRARKAVAGFGIRAGVPVGCKVTIRRERMYEFLDRLISVVLPRIRDFRGLSTDSFDGNGNFSLGIDEHFVFPEIDPDSLENLFGLDVTIVTSADSDPAGLELLRLLGMPFRGE
jgi:large subunit ribosomal protein L5